MSDIGASCSLSKVPTVASGSHHTLWDAPAQVLSFYEKPWWRKEGLPLSEQVTVALEPHAFNPDHPLYIDSVFDVSPPGGPGVLASFL